MKQGTDSVVSGLPKSLCPCEIAMSCINAGKCDTCRFGVPGRSAIAREAREQALVGQSPICPRGGDIYGSTRRCSWGQHMSKGADAVAARFPDDVAQANPFSAERLENLGLRALIEQRIAGAAQLQLVLVREIGRGDFSRYRWRWSVVAATPGRRTSDVGQRFRPQVAVLSSWRTASSASAIRPLRANAARGCPA